MRRELTSIERKERELQSLFVSSPASSRPDLPDDGDSVLDDDTDSWTEVEGSSDEDEPKLESGGQKRVFGRSKSESTVFKRRKASDTEESSIPVLNLRLPDGVSPRASERMKYGENSLKIGSHLAPISVPSPRLDKPFIRDPYTYFVWLDLEASLALPLLAFYRLRCRYPLLPSIFRALSRQQMPPPL